MQVEIFPRLLLLAAAFLFSTGGMAVKSCGLPDGQIAGLRCGLAALVFLIALPSARRWPGRRSLLVGLAYASTLTLYVLSNKNTTAVNAIFLQATAPIYIVLLGPRLLGEKTHLRDLALMVLMAAGLVFLLTGDVTTTEVAADPLKGNIFGFLAGISWALTIMGLRWMESSPQSNEGAVSAVMAGNGIAFLASLTFSLPWTQGTLNDWLWLGYLGVFQVALAYICLTAGMRRVPAFEASLLLLVEPVFSPLWAFWVHAEVPSRLAMLGAGLVLLATALKPLLDRRAQEHGVDGDPV